MNSKPEPKSTLEETELLHQQLLEFPRQFKEEIHKIVIGQESILDLLVIALFCNGHVLLTGVPGLAKTLLIKTLSSLFNLEFNRIQCTPDLMPSDISGVEILEDSPQTIHERHFRFIKGPVFTNLLLADEINRTSPRTQAALLQAMQEKQVTVAGKTYHLPAPFIVFATQNPIDSEGTYPLPEAQLDRFLFNVNIGYPSLEEEIQIAERPSWTQPSELTAIFESGMLSKFQKLVAAVPVAPHLVQWIVQFVRATRPQESDYDIVKQFVEWGAGVRASQNIVMAARAKALLAGENVVAIEHIHAVLKPVLRHRIIINFIGEAEKWTVDRIINLLIEQFSTKK